MLAKLVLAASLALGAASLVAQPRDAAACGDISMDLRARWVVQAHYMSIVDGKAKDVRAQWWDRAAIISIAPDGTKTHLTLAKVLPRWMKARKSLLWAITGAVERSDGLAEVTAEVTFNGKTYDEVMVVKYTDEGLRIVAERSTERAAVARASATRGSGY